MGMLNDLTIKYGVDALELGYTQHYNQLLSEVRNDFTKVLEIGVETGRSHRLWLEYFPNAKIYGYDIFEYGYDELQRLQEGNPFLDRSVMFKGDQSNIEDLNRFKSEYGGDFDMIIDDGGHTMEQMQTSLNHLWDSVKPGGIYVIEDLHSCSGQWSELYGYKVIQDGDTLTTDLLSSLENNDDTVTETSYISAEVVSKIRSEIEWCQTKIGVERYTNQKGQTYHWPTTLSFMRKNI
jgi:SAM-dependent methyltransferase